MTNEEFNAAFKANLTAARGTRSKVDCSKELATLSGLSPEYCKVGWSRWESGSRMPRPYIVHLMSRVLDVDIGELLDVGDRS